jgi:hypothetical protein
MTSFEAPSDSKICCKPSLQINSVPWVFWPHRLLQIARHAFAFMRLSGEAGFENRTPEYA